MQLPPCRLSFGGLLHVAQSERPANPDGTVAERPTDDHWRSVAGAALREVTAVVQNGRVVVDKRADLESGVPALPRKWSGLASVLA